MAELPTKSSSKGIQRAHIRRVPTSHGIKPIIINPKVKGRTQENNENLKQPMLKEVPREVVRPGAIVNLPPRRLPAKEREDIAPLKRKARVPIRNKDDLWDMLIHEPSLANKMAEFNNNIDLAKGYLYEYYTDHVLGEENTGEKYENMVEDVKKGYFMSFMDEDPNDGMVVTITAYGDFSKIPGIPRVWSDDWTLMTDPYEGALFKMNTGHIMHLEEKYWSYINLDDVGHMDPFIIQDQENLVEYVSPGYIGDALVAHYISAYLRERGIPHLYVSMPSQYPQQNDDWILIPKNFSSQIDKIKKIALKQANETYDRWKAEGKIDDE